MISEAQEIDNFSIGAMKINQRLYNKFNGIQQIKEFLKDGLSSEFSVLFMFTSMQDAYIFNAQS